MGLKLLKQAALSTLQCALMVACGGSTLATRPTASAAEVVQRCGSKSAEPKYLLRLLSEERRVQFEDETLRVFTAELDGVAPREAVAFADHAPRPFDVAGSLDDPAYPAPKRIRESMLWVFSCVQKRWQLTAERSYPLDDAQENDSADGPPGFKVVKAESLLADRDLLRVEMLDFRTGHSPFYTFRSFDLYGLRSNKLTPVFRCATTDEYRIGPARIGRQIERTIKLLTEKLPATISVSMTTNSDDPDDKLESSNPSDGLPAHESPDEFYHYHQIYRYDGTKFITEHSLCDERFRDLDDDK